MPENRIDGLVFAIDKEIASLRPNIKYLGLSLVGVTHLRNALDRIWEFVEKASTTNTVTAEQLLNVRNGIRDLPKKIQEFRDRAILDLVEPTWFFGWVNGLLREVPQELRYTSFDPEHVRLVQS